MLLIRLLNDCSDRECIITLILEMVTIDTGDVRSPPSFQSITNNKWYSRRKGHDSSYIVSMLKIIGNKKRIKSCNLYTESMEKLQIYERINDTTGEMTLTYLFYRFTLIFAFLCIILLYCAPIATTALSVKY